MALAATDAQLRQRLVDGGAALAIGGVGHDLRIHQHLFQAGGRTDVRPRGTLAGPDSHTDARQVSSRICRDLALHHQIVDENGRENRDVERLPGVDLAFEGRRGAERRHEANVRRLLYLRLDGFDGGSNTVGAEEPHGCRVGRRRLFRARSAEQRNRDRERTCDAG
jgi:hypothetical protein